MIDEKNMRSMLENMEQAAEEALRSDSAFYEALQSLKSEIDRDPRVQSAINNLLAAGSRVFSSLVPQIKIRVRTREGIVSLPPRHGESTAPASEPLAKLTQELRSAASSVIMRGRHREELDHILNEAIGHSGRFEGLASEIENAGNEVVICLDLSAYAQVRESSAPIHKGRKFDAVREPLSALLSVQDLKFLKDLKIKVIEN